MKSHAEPNNGLLITLLILSLAGRVTGQEAVSAAEATNAPVLAGCEVDYPPYCIVTLDKQADGFSVELLRAALKAVGREVTFKTGPWPEIMQDLAAGRLQALPLVGRTPEREALFDFTFPYLTMHGTMVVREDNSNIRTPGDLKGKRVATVQGENAEEYLSRANLGAIIVPLPSFEIALRELSNGNHDAVVVQKLVALQLMQKAGLKNLTTVGPQLYSQSFCFAVRKGDRERLAALNEGLSIVVADGTFRNLSAKWFSPIEAVGRVKSRIVVGGDREYPPYEFQDENGEPTGHNVELTQAIARQMGMAIAIKLGPWDAIRSDLAAGDIDAVQGMFYSVERDKQFAFSPPYAVVQHVIVRRANSPELSDMKDLAGKSILVMAGDIMQDLAVKQGYEKQLVVVDSLEEALRLLAAGKNDCALVAKVPALYWIQKNGWRNLRVGNHPVLSAEYCYAVPRGKEELLSGLTEGLTALKTTGEYRKIQAKWLSPYEPASRADFRTIVKYVLLAILPLLAVLAGSLLWSRSLQRQVASRTRELTAENSERKRAEADLNISRDLLRSVVDNAPIRVFWKDTALRYLGCNPAFARDAGLSSPADVIGKDDFQMVWREQAEAYRADDKWVMNSNTLKPSYEEPKTAPDGHTIWLSTSKVPLHDAAGTVIGILGIYDDITERKQAEERQQQMEAQLHQQQKLATIGTLARGAAHEINNPIMGMMNYAELIKERLDGASPLREYAGEIIHEGERVAKIVRHLLAFSQAQEQTPAQSLAQPADLVNDVLLPLESALRADQIAISVDVPESLPQVRCRTQQIHQVLTVLLTNAREALNERYPTADGNKVIALTARVISDQLRVSSNQSTEKASLKTDNRSLITSCLRLTVEDHGPGIPPDIANRIFDPFFTTKSRSEHSGLSLSTSQGIIREHGGTLTMESEAGQWTRFHVDLPVAEGGLRHAEGGGV